MRKVRKLLRPGSVVTITGAPGIGKTRVALEVARKQAKAGWDVAWVPLSLVGPDDSLIAPFGRSIGGGKGLSTIQALCDAIEGRPLLVVADDCDRVTGALKELLEAMLVQCDGLAVLTTTREALGAASERVCTLKPLSLPPADAGSIRDLESSEAGALFLARAREALEEEEADGLDPERVARICRALDGVPLALELAAARLRVLTLAQVDERLAGGLDLLADSRARSPAHHQTMPAAVAWSFARLPDAEARLLEQLSVARGGCSIEAVETLGAADPSGRGDGILDALASLVDRSLVRMRDWEGAARYSILEPVRRFALERLERSPDGGEEVRRRHADFYLRLAEGAMARLEQLEPAPRLLAELEQDLPNLREALDWSERHDVDLALRLHAALAWFWVASGRWVEGAARLRDARRLASGGPDPIRARLLSGSAGLAWLLHDVDTAEACARDAAELWGRLDGRHEVARSLALLAQVQAEAGDEDAARSTSDESLALAREVPDPWVLTWVLASRGAVFRTLGQLPEAEAVYAELASHSRSSDVDRPSVWLLEAPLGRAAVAILDDDPARAAVHALTAARAARSMDRRWYWARTLLAGAVVAARSGGAEHAAVSVGVLERLGAGQTPLLRHEQVLLWELRKLLVEALSKEGFEAAVAEGSAADAGDALRRIEGHLEGVVKTRPRWRPPPPAPATDAARSTPDLRIDALGPLEIAVRGSALSDVDWSYAKPRELLIYLACHPQGRTREQVGLAFWPEASRAQVKNRFHVALHRIRRVLGDPRAVVVDRDRYRIHPDWLLALDADRFEAGVKAAVDGVGRRALDRKNRSELAEALKLYRGDFLESESAGDWHLERRDRCRNLFLDGQSLLAESLLEEGELAEAAEGFERMIRVDDLSEVGYRGLMRSRAAAGDRATALRLYARLETTLRTELDALPESSTRRLADEIRADA